MKIKKGDRLENIVLPGIDGSEFNTEHLNGNKALISFYRFAGCPMCNLRINKMMKRYQEFGDDFKVVAIFNSSVKNLKRYATRHNAPFPILADEKYHYFKKYEVQKSLFVFLISQFTRVFQIWTAMFKGFIPYTLNGYVGILPVDILINQDGTVENVHYGKDIGDHLPLSDIINFSN